MFINNKLPSSRKTSPKEFEKVLEKFKEELKKSRLQNRPISFELLRKQMDF